MFGSTKIVEIQSSYLDVERKKSLLQILPNLSKQVSIAKFLRDFIILEADKVFNQKQTY